MPATMILMFPHETAYGQVRRLRISLPLIECLVDDVRYFRSADLPPPSGEDLRSVTRPKVDKMRGIGRVSRAERAFIEKHRRQRE